MLMILSCELTYIILIECKNSFGSSIQFTYEIEDDNPFFSNDIFVLHTENDFSIFVYRRYFAVFLSHPIPSWHPYTQEF